MTASLAEKFRANFAKARAAKKLTQQALAEKAGMSVSMMSMLERGQRTPPLDTVERLAEALGINPLDLLK